MNPEQIDYRPLAGMNHTWPATFKILLLSKKAVWLLLTIAVSAVGLVLSSTDVTGIPLLLYLGYAGFTHQDYKNNVWKRFAEANHWKYTDAGGDLPQSLQFGSRAKYNFSPGIEIPLGNGLLCQLFLCDCTIEYLGENRGPSRTYSFTVGSIVLPWSMPHIMLRSKAAKVKDRPDIANATSLQLEGNFNDYFDLQVEQGQQVNALMVLTPDIMQTLLTYNRREDIEIYSTLLSFIISGDKGDSEDVKMLIRSAFELTNQIVENIRLATAPAQVRPAQSAVPAPASQTPAP